MIGPHRLLANDQGPLVERFRLLVTALLMVKDGQVVRLPLTGCRWS